MIAAISLPIHVPHFAFQAKYVDPEKALEAKERGNEQFRAGQWAKAIEEYEEVGPDVSYFPVSHVLYSKWLRA